MTDRIIESEQDREMLAKFIAGHPLPFTATITPGKHRTNRQNKLQRKWLTEIAEQMSGTFESPENVRGYCKLHFGVPILRNENEAFRLTYDQRVKPLSYEAKLALMMEPLSLPVTSIMTTKQKTAYLDAIHKHFSEQGVLLTNPEDSEPGSSLSSSEPEATLNAAAKGGDGTPPPSSPSNSYARMKDGVS